MFKNKIILFILISVSVLFGASEKLEIIKSAAPQYIEGNRTIHYTLTIKNTSNTDDYDPITINDDMVDGLFSDANVTITNNGGFSCDVNTSDTASEITCVGMMEHDRVKFLEYDVIAPNDGRQVTNSASVHYGGSEIDTASITVTVFPNYDGNLDYNRDICYEPLLAEGAECKQSGSFFYGPDCNTSVQILRNSDGTNVSEDLLNVHVFKAYTSTIEEDACYTEESGVTCGNEKDLDLLLNRASSLYFKAAFNEAHDFSLGNFDSNLSDYNRTIVDINTRPVSGHGNNIVTSFEYIALIGQYNIPTSVDTIEEYIYPCGGGYSIPPPVTQLTTGGVNDVDLTDEDITLEQANYIDYATYDKVGTKIVNQPFLLGVTYLDADGNPAVYNGAFGKSGKIINAAILLSYETNGQTTPIWSGELLHNSSYVLTLENFSNDEATQEPYPIIDKAFRSGKITAQLVDYGSFFTAVEGLNCGNSSLESSLCLLPACLNSPTQILNVFPLENYPHVATCIYGDGGGASPCDSNAYIGNCGGKKLTISPSKYDHDLGCTHCLADAIAPYRDSDPFSTRPKDFSLEVPVLDGNLDELYRAGTTYPIELNATTGDTNITQSPDYNTTLEGDDYPSKVIAVIGLEANLSLTCPYDDNESQTINFSNGYSTGPISYSNVGKVKLVIMDQNWTSIDQVVPTCIIDSDETNPALDPAHLGRVGCKIIAEKTMTFIPHHFNIDANLTDHNSDHNFTYLHDINKYDNADDNHSMGAELNISIQAMNEGDINITTNYIEGCYAKDTNLTLSLSGANIDYPGSTPALTHFLYYNPKEDNGTVDGEGNYSFPTPISSPISIISLPIENTSHSFSSDGPGENGTTHIEYKLNFDRKQNLVVNPFNMILSEVNITEIDVTLTDPDKNLVKGETGSLSDQNATLYYARASSSEFFYEDIRTPVANTPITINVYCDFGFTVCPSMGIETGDAQIDELNWWLSLGHNGNNVKGGDGNVSIKVGSPLIEPDATNSSDQAINDITYSSGNEANIIILSTGRGVKNDVNVSRGSATPPPLTVPLELVRDDLSAPTFYTNEWLIYNKYHAIDPPSPFYKVRFIGDANWTGEGETGYVMETNASYKKSKRLDW